MHISASVYRCVLNPSLWISYSRHSIIFLWYTYGISFLGTTKRRVSVVAVTVKNNVDIGGGGGGSRSEDKVLAITISSWNERVFWKSTQIGFCSAWQHTVLRILNSWCVAVGCFCLLKQYVCWVYACVCKYSSETYIHNLCILQPLTSWLLWTHTFCHPPLACLIHISMQLPCV